MTTVKQIERAWSAKQHERLFCALVACRPEGRYKAEFDSGWTVPAATMGILWLDDMGQAYVPLYGQLLRALLAGQQADGGWGDLVTTSLALRALMLSHGHGIAIDRGLAFLANLQKSEGIWPKVPLRRMPEDAQVSAIVLCQLGDRSEFQSAVRFDAAVAWFEQNEVTLEPATRELWRRAARRCRLVPDQAQAPGGMR